MPIYIVLSRLSPKAFDDPSEFRKLAGKVSAEIKRQCPGVRWMDSYATLGRFDIVDLIEAGDAKQAQRAAMIIRAYGHAATETLPATPWDDFLASL
ncbi:MAG TPA: GYD domain-containing protein [Gammaproteobacteria bacterium]|nr:GYD domain-containing protein [Gammaproteobacteria bacterium]